METPEGITEEDMCVLQHGFICRLACYGQFYRLKDCEMESNITGHPG